MLIRRAIPQVISPNEHLFYFPPYSPFGPLPFWFRKGTARVLLDEADFFGCKNQSTSTKTPSTLIPVGVAIEDDVSPVEGTVSEGSAKFFGAVLLLKGSGIPLKVKQLQRI